MKTPPVINGCTLAALLVMGPFPSGRTRIRRVLFDAGTDSLCRPPCLVQRCGRCQAGRPRRVRVDRRLVEQ